MKAIHILSREDHPRGTLLTLQVGGRQVQILLTVHATDRMALWRISEDRALTTLLYPTEVLRGHGNRFIAQRLEKTRLVRVIYEYDGKLPVVITLYNPIAARYFRGGGAYEDQILT